MATRTAEPTVLSSREISFLLEEWLDIAALTERPAFAGQTVSEYRHTLRLAEDLATAHFEPFNRASDSAEPRVENGRVVLHPSVQDGVDAYREAGFIGAALPESVGGMDFPMVLSSAIHAWFAAANVGTSNYTFLTAAAAGMLMSNASPEQTERWVPPLVEGRFLGTMCLSEPQAGSSLADITTAAHPQPDGTYRVRGTKMWISGGEHELSDNIVHLLLAKIPGGPAGVKGISLFIVPKFLLDEDGIPAERNDVVLAGLNHKLGQRGTVNTVLDLGSGAHTPGGLPGAVAYLVGEPHQGLAYMFDMMNEARIGVGLAASALGYVGFLKSAKYARERAQGRPVSGRDPLAPPVPIIEHPDVRRMLLAQKSYAEGGLALGLYCARLVDDLASHPDDAERVRTQQLLDVLTPIAKSWPSQWCLEGNALAIQVLGGAGYTRDFELELHYRDNRLNPIHEGTHGIQALDLLGRKVVIDGGAGFATLLERMRDTIAAAMAAGRTDDLDQAGTTDDLDQTGRTDRPDQPGPADGLAAGVRIVEAYVDRLQATTQRLSAEPDRELALANATLFLEAAGHIVVAWLWLDQLTTIGAS